ncbi:MAG: DEAD/DEAH box helicase family protein [Phycisphaerales bacterium]
MKKLILTTPNRERPTDPLRIFKGLTLRGGVENPWETQADALRQWHKEHRAASDVVVQMNTGGGKTLVGLLMAQSLVNEERGRVVYLCANNLLLEQTLERAKEIGLSPATRYGGKWVDEDRFDGGETFCLTNYHTLFNAFSTFREYPPDAIILDDAHVADGMIRECFSVRVPSDHRSFQDIIQILRAHFANTPHATLLQQVSDREFTPVLFVPMYVSWQHAEEIRRTLLKGGVADDDSTKYSWPNIQNNLKHCAVLMTGAGIEISPLCTPLDTLPYFGQDTRRVYLTATMPSPTAFARTFGVEAPVVISPSGRSGDAQRLFIFAPGDSDEVQRNSAKDLVAKYKSCVISPSKKKAEEWVPPSKIYERNAGQGEIERFKNADPPEMLGFVARYDGIDLPGKSCNILILDRKPTGECLLDRFIDEAVKVESIRISHTATRIVQAIGRIFRSNTDHGVVILVGVALQSWVRNRRHHPYLPKRFQQQVHLASALLEQVRLEETDWPELIDAVLTGDSAWDDAYRDLDEYGTIEGPEDADWFRSRVLDERAAYEQLWDGQVARAADMFAVLADEAEGQDQRLAAWYAHWAGVSLMSANDRSRAASQFVRASNIRAELGRPSKDERALQPVWATAAGVQANALASWYGSKRRQMVLALTQVDGDLRFGSETSAAEEALKVLGKLLGLRSSRPDNELGIGPDVLWTTEDGHAPWAFELKTDKDKRGVYKKEDIGQCHQHEQWLAENYGDAARLAIVGHLLRVSEKASPSDTLLVASLAGTRELLDRARSVFDAVDAGEKSDIAIAFQTWLNHFGLLWPQCVDAVESRLASDLKEE